MTRLLFPAAMLLLALIVALALTLGGPQSPADAATLFSLQRGSLVPAARLLTRLGDWWFVLGAGGLGAAWLALRGAPRNALLLAGLLLSERLVVTLLKMLFDRARPDTAGHLTAVHSMAFPSGHSANAMTLGLGLALLFQLGSQARRAAIALALLYALLVGLSRLVLGVHWPSDVIGGWALGTLWTLLLVRLFAERRPCPRIPDKVRCAGTPM